MRPIVVSAAIVNTPAEPEVTRAIRTVPCQKDGGSFYVPPHRLIMHIEISVYWVGESTCLRDYGCKSGFSGERRRVKVDNSFRI